MTANETPMMTFWRGLNEALRGEGYPELRYGDARPLFERAVAEARRDAMARAMRAAA